MSPTLTSCSGCGKENPRRTIALTTANCVIAPPMPRARTSTARRQNDFSLKRMRRPMRISWRKASRIITRSWVGVGDDEERFEDEMRDEAEMDSRNGSESDKPVLHDEKTPPVRRFVCGGP